MLRGDEGEYGKTLVICLHTLEHITDLRSFMNTYSDLFKRCEAFLVEVPMDSPYTRVSSMHYEHVQFFTKESIKRLFENNGVSVSARYCWGYGGRLPCIQVYTRVAEGERHDKDV